MPRIALVLSVYCQKLHVFYVRHLSCFMFTICHDFCREKQKKSLGFVLFKTKLEHFNVYGIQQYLWWIP
jgi:hypothetical protein